MTADMASVRDPIQVGISACLLGDEVRYDGGHKRHTVLVDILGPQVEWVAVCPEVEMGLGVPREPLRLEHDGRHTRLISIDTQIDHTERMNQWSAKRLGELSERRISGYILKSRSPSCGPRGVPIYTTARNETETGRGLFAAALRRRFPHLPIEEETAFTDAPSVEHFLKRAREYDHKRVS